MITSVSGWFRVQGSGKIIDQYYQISRASACPDGCVHIKLSPAEHEIMNESDWQRCLDLLADEFKFNADYATIVEHTKKGRTHRHIVFPVFDLNSNKRLNLWRSKVRLMSVAKKMEMQLGHDLVPLNGYSKKRVSERLKKTGYDHYARLVEAVPDSGVGYGHKEAGLAKRNGYDVAKLRTRFTSLIEQSDSVKAFKSALNDAVFELIEKGKRKRLYFRAIDTPDLELNATKLL